VEGELEVSTQFGIQVIYGSLLLSRQINLLS